MSANLSNQFAHNFQNTNTRKKILWIVIAIAALLVGGVIFGIRRYTSLLSGNISEESVQKNNTNPVSPTDEDENTAPSAEFSLTELIVQTVDVPEQYRTGVFATPHTLLLPADFRVSVFAADLSAPRHFDFDDEGNMIVADKGAGTIELFPDVNDDGVADTKITIDHDLRVAHSVDFYHGDLYLAEEHQLSVYRELKSDGTYRIKEKLVSLPTGGNHTTRTVVVGPDEKLYVSIGSTCNSCEEKDRRRAAVVRYNLDGSGEEIFAEGLRNSVGMIFRSNVLWSVDNGRDLLGDDLPPEEVNIVTASAHFGWPYCYGNKEHDRAFLNKEAFCKKKTASPLFSMTAHSAPLGLAFVPDDSSWSDILADTLVVAFHGSWNRTVPTGYKIVRIDTTLSGSAPINFITGWLGDDGEVWGRPVDVRFHDNAMYISDDKAGAIYRVTLKR